jgi:hypothetical protein
LKRLGQSAGSKNLFGSILKIRIVQKLKNSTAIRLIIAKQMLKQREQINLLELFFEPYSRN